ncbi:MAG: hypothetical protein CVU57_03045 [Deltaproteobacteria bacterium HGW-Deltaproteobacteria-15]|jgi:hypothetical protein|nr:MAG: hypothetical protein CVU57_03045 [Deltaproteobacteria bacterium HGW-Deltaproteobacteria-15]
MIDQTALLQSAISEYDSIVNSAARQPVRKVAPEQLARTMCKDHDWTDRGARTIISLANEYGAFMLRNALALAIVLDKEDGDLEF